MKKNHELLNLSKKGAKKKLKKYFSKYPINPISGNVYNQEKEETEIGIKHITPIIAPNEKKDFKDNMSGDDLGIPNSALDDQQESIGSEYEENNYYALDEYHHIMI